MIIQCYTGHHIKIKQDNDKKKDYSLPDNTEHRILLSLQTHLTIVIVLSLYMFLIL